MSFFTKIYLFIIVTFFCLFRMYSMPYQFRRFILEKEGKIKTIDLVSDIHIPYSPPPKQEKDSRKEAYRNQLSQLKSMSQEQIMGWFKNVNARLSLPPFKLEKYNPSSRSFLETLYALDKSTNQKIDLLWEQKGWTERIIYLLEPVETPIFMVYAGFELSKHPFSNIQFIASDTFQEGFTNILPQLKGQITEKSVQGHLPLQYVIEKIKVLLDDEKSPIAKRINALQGSPYFDFFQQKWKQIKITLEQFYNRYLKKYDKKTITVYGFSEIISQSPDFDSYTKFIREGINQPITNLEMMLNALSSKKNHIIIFVGGKHVDEIAIDLAILGFKQVIKIGVSTEIALVDAVIELDPGVFKKLQNYKAKGEIKDYFEGIEFYKLIRAIIADDIKEVKTFLKNEKIANALVNAHIYWLGQWKWVKPLEMAKSPEMIELLINKGARVNDFDKDLLLTALHQAVLYLEQTKKLVPALIAKGGNINIQNVLGETPLHLAAREGPFAIEVLLINGADPTIKNNDGLTPKELAKKYQQKMALKKFEKLLPST